MLGAKEFRWQTMGPQLSDPDLSAKASADQCLRYNWRVRYMTRPRKGVLLGPSELDLHKASKTETDYLRRLVVMRELAMPMCPLDAGN